MCRRRAPFLREYINWNRHIISCIEKGESGKSFSGIFLPEPIILSFIKTGDTQEARKLLSEAIERNKFVVSYLAKIEKMPKYLPDSYALHSEDEAVCYVDDFLKAWEIVPGAIDWLKNYQKTK